MYRMVNTRIAPTPSGLLHRGNAFNFLLTSFLAQNSGTIRLRIDDLDAPRVRPEYLQDIFNTIGWLQIKIDSGPKNVEEQQTIYSQQLRIPRYQEFLNQLVERGEIFACTCSRKEIQEKSSDGQYPGTCRFKNLPLDTLDTAWRLKTDSETVIQFEDALMGKTSINLFETARDFVVRRRDGVPAYHIASLVDDVDFDSNTIVRGKDLLTSTAIQLHLAELLGMSSFPTIKFYHHPLIETTEGEKLSKSAGSTSIKSIRESGVSFEIFYADFVQWMQSFVMA